MKKLIKNNYKFIISLILLAVVLNINLPYYIDAPGGISDINDKIIIDGYDSKGSFNLAYVKEYKATFITLLFSLIDKDFKVLKKNDVLLGSETYKDYSIRDKIFMEESISNAIYVAYFKANKKIDIKSDNYYVSYISETSNTNLSVGDKIISIDGIKINSKDDINEYIKSHNVGDKVKFIVEKNKEKIERYSYITSIDNEKKLGIVINNIREYNTDIPIEINFEDNESGPSGGLITALSIYNSLVKEDITKGLKIVGTGTIDIDGNVGSIGGVEYKLKSAVKAGADLFIVPKDENYDEAIKIKKKNKYDIEILGISTFDEVLNYLDKID